MESLKSAILIVFRDVSTRIDSQDLIIHVNWGDFMYHMSNEEIKTKSIIAAQLIPIKLEVSSCPVCVYEHIQVGLVYMY